MSELEFHPVADIFPMMSEREFADLTADIAENGLREPVWLHDDGRIIDGRNRYQACRKAGVAPTFRTHYGHDSGLVGFVVSLNLHRRHLSESQRAMVAARAEQYEQGRPKKDANWQVKRSDAANLFKASERSIARAKKVQESGVRELGKAVESGRVAVSTAATIADAPPEEQREVIAADNEKEIIRRAQEIQRRKKEEKEKVKAAHREELAAKAAAVVEHMSAGVEVADGPELGQWWQLGRHLLYCGDSADDEFIDRAHGASFAFADPPYNAGKAAWDHGFEWKHDYLSKVAEIVAVTPGISAVADFFGGTTMPYRWSMAAWITNGMTRGALGFGNWIYLALFSTAEPLHRNAQDVLRVTVDASSTGESNHESRKPARLLVDLIELFTNEGDTVVDPFLGSGTTLFAADKTGRRCIGAEINPKYFGEIIAKYGPEAKRL